MSKRIIIVGASSGLGHELAALYAAGGNKVGVVARRELPLQQLQEQFPGAVSYRAADMTGENFEHNLHELINELGGLDIFIITASVVSFSSDLSSPGEQDTIQINVNGFACAVQYAWNYFSIHGGGQIVGVSSIAAARGNKAVPAYHASKSFQAAYLESIRIRARYEKRNIIVTQLVPGYIDTAMGVGERVFWSTPVARAARLALRAINGQRKVVFVPKRWFWIFHFQRFLPIFIYDWLMNGAWKLKTKR